MKKVDDQKVEQTVSITIKKFSNGEIETNVESKGPIDISNLLGILEFSKMDFMMNHKEREVQKQFLENQPKVKIKLTDEYLKILPNLVKEGYKSGDDYELPQPVFDQIQQILNN